MFPEKIRRNETFLVLILIALCLTLFFFRLGARPFWDIDEGKHATKGYMPSQPEKGLPDCRSGLTLLSVKEISC
jgi:hypothetical protein